MTVVVRVRNSLVWPHWSIFSRMNSNMLPEKLIIHFDVNKTIIFVDPAGGKSTEDLVNGSLAQYFYGNILENPKNPIKGEDWGLFKWEPVTDKPLVDSPDPKLVSYVFYLDQVLYPDLHFDSSVSHSERLKLTTQLKAKRDYAKNKFTSPGFPGEHLVEFYDLFLKKLSSKSIDGKNKYVFLLPSFFYTLIELTKRNLNWTYVIRTFGSDIDDIAQEIDSFCNGTHPDHPVVLFNGQNGSRDLRIGHIGTLFRNGNTQDDIYYIADTINQIDSVEKKTLSQIKEFYGDKPVVSGVHDIYNDIVATVKPRAIRDYYPWWQANNRSPMSGKPFFVDLKNPKIAQIFFDDNILMGKDTWGIVDIRTEHGDILDFTKELNTRLVHVEPLESVFEEDYFVRHIDACLANVYKK